MTNRALISNTILRFSNRFTLEDVIAVIQEFGLEISKDEIQATITDFVEVGLLYPHGHQFEVSRIKL